MKLTHLELENYRRFDRLSIDFDDRLTVIIGDNDAGKTTVLDAAAVALGTFLVRFPDVKGPGLRGEDARAQTRLLGRKAETQAQYPVGVEARACLPVESPDGVWRPHEISWSRTIERENSRMTSSKAHDLIEVSDQYQKAIREGHAGVVMPLLGYYGTRRLHPIERSKWGVHSTAYLEASTRFDAYAGALDSQLSEISLVNWFKAMTAQELDEGEPIPAFKAVRNVIGACVARITGYDDARVRYFSGQLRVDYTNADGQQCLGVPLSQLSDGYRGVIGLVADIARRMTMMNPALEDEAILQTPGVVLIDEIDLHLHPRWQERILSDLLDLFPGIQFIVTTHAPLVISSVHRRNVRVIRHDDAGYHADVPSMETYGNSTGAILRLLMGAPERPREVQDLMDRFRALLDRERYGEAREVLARLANGLGDDNPEVNGMQSELFFYTDDAG